MLRRDNSSGVTGVDWHRGKWRATIRVAGIKIHLGRFVRLRDAAEARRIAEASYFGDNDAKGV